jgi:AraC-like DNA-binding protein
VHLPIRGGWEATVGDKTFVCDARQVQWSPATIVQFAEFVVMGLLLYHPHNHSDALRRSAQAIVPRDIKRAVDYLEAHPDSPLAVADLVAASQVAGRTLFQHFRDFKGTSPMRYLGNARFAKVREALLRAGPEDSVTAIATACGFRHMGRFAAKYRRRFGERPSDALRRDIRGREIARGRALWQQDGEARDSGGAPVAQGRPRLGNRERAAIEVRRRLRQRGETFALGPA